MTAVIVARNGTFAHQVSSPAPSITALSTWSVWRSSTAWATPPPQESPTRCARRSGTRVSMSSATRSAVSARDARLQAVVRPKPGKSRARQWNDPWSLATRSRHIRPLAPAPWRKTTAGAPGVPASSTWIPRCIAIACLPIPGVFIVKPPRLLIQVPSGPCLAALMSDRCRSAVWRSPWPRSRSMTCPDPGSRPEARGRPTGRRVHRPLRSCHRAPACIATSPNTPDQAGSELAVHPDPDPVADRAIHDQPPSAPASAGRRPTDQPGAQPQVRASILGWVQGLISGRKLVPAATGRSHA